MVAVMSQLNVPRVDPVVTCIVLSAVFTSAFVPVKLTAVIALPKEKPWLGVSPVVESNLNVVPVGALGSVIDTSRTSVAEKSVIDAIPAVTFWPAVFGAKTWSTPRSTVPPTPPLP
ncbi:MAG: hypothetical protein EBR23_15395, partial [Planctomycetia bacterium]|nr:hypothetical protein [Planctomycetia bacterium]